MMLWLVVLAVLVVLVALVVLAWWSSGRTTRIAPRPDTSAEPARKRPMGQAMLYRDNLPPGPGMAG